MPWVLGLRSHAPLISTTRLARLLALVQRVHVPKTIQFDDSVTSTEINGYKYHTEISGKPESTPVIVVHGGPGLDSEYLKPLKKLSRNHRVIVYDQRGTGLSARVDKKNLTLEQSLDDLHSIAEHFAKGGKLNSLVIAGEGPWLLAIWQNTRKWCRRPLWLNLGIGQEIRRYRPGGPYQCEGQNLPPDMFKRVGYEASAGHIRLLKKPESFTYDLTRGISEFHGDLMLISTECSSWPCVSGKIQYSKTPFADYSRKGRERGTLCVDP